MKTKSHFKMTKLQKMAQDTHYAREQYNAMSVRLESELAVIKKKIEEAAPEAWYAQVGPNVIYADATKGRLLLYRRLDDGWGWEYLSKTMPEEIIGWHNAILRIIKDI